MDTDRFAQLSRFLSSKMPNRREVLIGLLGSGAIATAAVGTDASSKAKKRRRRRRRNRNQTVPPPPPPPFVCPATDVCGPGCCASDMCFAKTVLGTPTPIDYDCCPAELLCKSVKEGYEDQCCYLGEYCDPQLPTPFNELGICCRPCNGECLKSQFECVDGVPVLNETARLPRHRR